MDVLYFLKHSPCDDLELKYSLRSVERYMPWVRRVVVFGDRPEWLAGPESGIFHVPHEAIAWIGPYRTPVTNWFLMFYLTALLPELDEEYIFFSDDFVLLRDLTPDEAQRNRYLQDLATLDSRGKGLWMDSLWRTYDLLKRLGYGTLNYETHVPTWFRKQWVLDAYRDLRDFVTEDRWQGAMGITAILSHIQKHHPRPLVHLKTEGSRVGFHGKPPAYEEVVSLACAADARFLNFDDAAFGPDMQRFLAERFPRPCRYERHETPSTPTSAVVDTSSVPAS
ncbi:hypothetical protein [Nocardia sp. NPDC002869]|uniref:hypothetical protein n=1 Tax=Nocardia sp. NPDC002869 TaxID=3161032 RepID=UPI00398D1A61